MSTTARPTGLWSRAIDLFSRNWFNRIVGILMLLTCLTILYPLIRLIQTAFVSDGQLSFVNFRFVTGQEWFPQVFVNSFIAVGIAGLLSIGVASILAWLNECTDATLGLVGSALPLVTLLIPPTAMSIGWAFLADPRLGYLNTLIVEPIFGSFAPDFRLNIYSWPGLVFLYMLYLIPYAYVLISSALRNNDPALEEASRVSGASIFRTLVRVSLASIKQAYAGAALLAVIVGMALYSVPTIIGTPADIDIASVRLVRLVTTESPPQIEAAVVMGLFLTTLILPLWLLQRHITSSGNFSRVGGRGARTGRLRLGKYRWLARSLVISYLFATVIMPLLALLVVALEPFWTGTINLGNSTMTHFNNVVMVDEITRLSLRNSVLFGLGAGGAAVLIATLAALYVREARGYRSRFVSGSTLLPAVVSNIVIAIAFLTAFGGSPFSLGGTLTLLVLALLVAYMPQAAVATTSAVSQLGDDLLDASRVSGAGPFRTLHRVALPALRQGLMSAWALLFVLIAGELSVAAILSTLNSPVVGFALLRLWEVGSYGTVAALALVITFTMITIVLLMMWYGRPKQSRARSRLASTLSGPVRSRS